MQKSIDFIISRLSFARLVRELDEFSADFRIQSEALETIQTIAEIMLATEFISKSAKILCEINLFINKKVTNLCVIHAKRVTFQVKDMQLIRILRDYMMRSENSYSH